MITRKQLTSQIDKRIGVDVGSVGYNDVRLIDVGETYIFIRGESSHIIPLEIARITSVWWDERMVLNA